MCAAVREERRRGPLGRLPPAVVRVRGVASRRWTADEQETIDEMWLYVTLDELRAKCRCEGGVSSGMPIASK